MSENKMKIENCQKLAELIAKKLPWARQTNKIAHLRNIKLDPTSHGKAVLIWYGCHNSQDKIELRVTRNLGVTCLSFEVPPAQAKAIEDEVTQLLNGKMFNAKAAVTLCMGSYIPKLPEVKQQKVEIVPVVPVVPVLDLPEVVVNQEVATNLAVA